MKPFPNVFPFARMTLLGWSWTGRRVNTLNSSHLFFISITGRGLKNPNSSILLRYDCVYVVICINDANSDQEEHRAYFNQ